MLLSVVPSTAQYTRATSKDMYDTPDLSKVDPADIHLPYGEGHP